MLRALTIVTASVVLALGLTGCGSDEPAEKALPTAEPSPSTPPGLDTTEPKPPEEMSETSRSAEEFGRYFVDVVQYAIRTRDSTPVAELTRDQAACAACRELSTYVEGLKKDEQWEQGDDIQVGRLKARQLGASAYNVKGPMSYPAVTFVDVKGKPDDSDEASLYNLDLDLIWDADRNRWQIDDYTFAQKGRN